MLLKSSVVKLHANQKNSRRAELKTRNGSGWTGDWRRNQASELEPERLGSVVSERHLSLRLTRLPVVSEAQELKNFQTSNKSQNLLAAAALLICCYGE